MKNKTQNSRIRFAKKEVKLIVENLTSWIDADKKSFGGRNAEIVQNILDEITLAANKEKEIYIYNLNCSQLVLICNILAESYLQKENTVKDKKVLFTILKNTEEVIGKNYTDYYRDLLYPTYSFMKKSNGNSDSK